MPAQFDDLPYELRHEIFQLAFLANLHPRVVEIFFKNGEIYSKSLPPPLLQVCQLSRHVTLLYYKPWLPQFKGLVAHRPWADVVERERGGNLSRLQNVCIDLKYDMLVINTKQWAPWNFGALERQYIKTLAINLGGWIDWVATPGLARQFDNLRRLTLFDGTQGSDMLLYKGRMIEKEMLRMFRMQKDSGMRYSGAKIYYEDIPGALEWERDIADWITYKYPKGHRSKSVSKSSRYGLPKEHRQRQISSSSPSNSQPSKKRARDSLRPSQASTSSRKTSKKSHSKNPSTTYSVPIQSVRIYPSNVPICPSSLSRAPDDRRRSSTSAARTPTRVHSRRTRSIARCHEGSTSFKTSWPSKHVNPQARAVAALSRLRSPPSQSSRSPVFPQKSDVSEPTRQSSLPLPCSQESFASIWEGLELARSPTPEIRPASDPYHDIEESDANMEPAEMFPPSPKLPQMPARKFINPFEDWDDTEMSFLTAPKSELDRMSSPAATWRHVPPTAVLIDDLESDAVGSAPLTIIHEVDEAPSFRGLDNLEYLTNASDLDDYIEMLESTYLNDNSTAPRPLEAVDESMDITDEEPRESFEMLDLTRQENSMDTCRLEEIEVRPSESMDLDNANNDEETSFTYSHLQSTHMELENPIVNEDLSFTPPTSLPSLIPDIEDFPSSQLSLHSQLSIVDEEEERHIPERIVAKRKTSQGSQLLVQWEAYPEEKDWTWEPEDVILEDAPAIVMDWTMNKDDSEPEAEAKIEGETGAETVAVEYIPEKILSKRKFKGVQHYLVQWEGYPKVEDRTWEPCERFRIDTPLLVENFEIKKKKR